MFKKTLLLWLALASLSLAKPVQSPRGLCTFEIPGNLTPHGGMSWGDYPGVVIEMREEFAEGQDMKPFTLSVAPTTPNGKKSAQDTEVDGAQGQLITRIENNTTTILHLILHQGNYNFGWTLNANNVPKDEAAAIFGRLKDSIKFTPDPLSASGPSHEVRDPSGALSLKIPGNFGGGGHKFSNGQMMIILTPLREAKPETQHDWVTNYIPRGFVSYQRRNNIEVGGKTGAMILAESEDHQMETQMVLLVQGNSAVVITFAGPAKLRQQLSLLRETVVSQAQWTSNAKKEE